jgi:predicted outer membrane repeat protein
MPSTLLRRSIIAFALAFAAVPSCAQAANTYTVDSTVDMPDASVADGQCRTADDTCTLRAAIQQANATVNQPDGPDRIVFAPQGGDLIRLSAQLPAITTDLDIRGPGASDLTLWGNSSAQQRIFQITFSAHVRISGLTITHGFGGTGGGVFTSGAYVTIADCVISSSAAAQGAGIYIVGGSLTLERSTIAGNGATEGGGLFSWAADVDIVDSTFDGNGAASNGGAILGWLGTIHVTGSTLSHNSALVNGGALMATGDSIELLNSTLVGNSARSTGGAIYADDANVTASNSTIAGNSAAAGGGIADGGNTLLRATLVAGNRAPSQTDLASVGRVVTGGGNLVGDGTGINFIDTGGPADQIGTAAAPIDPKLARDSSGAVRLRDRGGRTQTTTLLPGSPAIDRGVDSPAPATDQRGFARRLGAHVDVGAVEGALPAPAVPGTQWTVEDTPLVFSARTSNAISVSEPASAGAIELSVADGTGTLAIAGKPAAVKVAGDGTDTVTLRGTMADVAEAIDGLVFTPAPNANGPMTLIVTTSDDGDSDDAATATVPIQVREINDPPIATEDALAAFEHGAKSRLIPFSELLRNDSPGPVNEADQELTITDVAEPKGGTAELSSAGIVFTPEAGYSGPAGFAYTLRDNGSTDHKHDAQSATGYARFEIKEAPAAPDVPVTPATPPATPGNPGTVPSPEPVVAPTIVRVSPSRNASALANVVAVFSEPMDPRTLTTTTVKLTTRVGASVPATVRYDMARRRVVLDPRGRLAAGMQYTATIRAGVKDAAGVPLAKTMSWTFTIRRP